MNLISIVDVKDKLDNIFELSAKLKNEAKRGIFNPELKNKTLAMIFEKASTRTRVSFEVAMTQLGGHAIYLAPRDTQLQRGESIKDTAITLSKYVDGIMIRAYRHENVLELGKYSTVPVINGLTDLEHPCQVISDLFTIKEHKGFDARLAYVGDGNNVCNSLILGCAMTGMTLSVGCPEGYTPDKKIVETAAEFSDKITIHNNAVDAVKAADIVYTDVWISMGQDAEKEKRIEVFKEFQVNSTLLENANNPLIMHCLPAKRGFEITDEILDSENSIVFEQAENRLYVQKALLCMLL